MLYAILSVHFSALSLFISCVVCSPIQALTHHHRVIATLLETNILAELSFRQHEDNFDKNFFFFVSVKFSRAHFLSIQLWGPVAEIMTPKNNIPLTENKIDGRKHTGSGHGGNLSELPLVVDDRKCLQPCNYLGKFD